MRYVFALLAISLFAAAIMMGGTFMAFVNAPSLLVVFGGFISITLAFHSPGEFYDAVCAGLCSQEMNPADSKRHVAVLSTARTTVMGSGVAGVLIGLVQMLQSLEDPSTIGPAMAVALLCALYSVMLSELLLGPMINRVHARAASAADTSDKAAGPNNVLNGAALFLPLFSFFVMMMALQ